MAQKRAHFTEVISDYMVGKARKQVVLGFFHWTDMYEFTYHTFNLTICDIEERIGHCLV